MRRRERKEKGKERRDGGRDGRKKQARRRPMAVDWSSSETWLGMSMRADTVPTRSMATGLDGCQREEKFYM